MALDAGTVETIYRLRDEMSAKLKEIQDHVRGTTGVLATMTATMGGMVGAQAILGAVGQAWSALKDSVFTTNAVLETTTLQFETLMGDADRAREHVAALFDIAKTTPFETGPIIEASLKLQTFGGAALNTQANIRLLGDAAAATNAPINDLGFWVGRLYASLKGGQPFGESAMRLQELAVLTPQVRFQMEALQKSGASSEETFRVFTQSLGHFEGAMLKQAGTWKGVVSTFKDTVNLVAAEAFRPLFETLRDGMGQLNAFLSQKALADGVRAFATGFSGAMRTAVSSGVQAFDAIRGAASTASDVLAKVPKPLRDVATYSAEAAVGVWALHAAFLAVRATGIGAALTGIAKPAAELLGMIRAFRVADFTVTVSGWAAALMSSIPVWGLVAAAAAALLGTLRAFAGDWGKIFDLFLHPIQAVKNAFAQITGAPMQTTAAQVSEAAALMVGAIDPTVAALAGLRVLLDNLGTAGSLDALNARVLQLSESGWLTSKAMQEVAKELLASGIQADKLPPALRGIVQAYGKLNAEADPLTKKQREMAETLVEIDRALIQLTPAQAQQVTQWQALGVSAGDMAKALGVAEGAINHYFKTLEEHFDRIEASRGTEEEARKAVDIGMAGMNVLKNMAVASGTLRIAARNLGAGWTDTMRDMSKEARERMREIRGEFLTTGQVIGDAFIQLPNLLIQSLTGGGGVSGALKAFGVQIGQGLLGEDGPLSGAVKAAKGGLTKMFGEGVGKAFAAAIPVIGALVGPGLELLWSGIKKLFGGPGQAELEGRKVVADIEKQLNQILTASQKLEAGGSTWKGTVIAVRDAYQAVGLSSAEAEAAVKRLWEASKRGPEAVREAMRPIQAAIDQAKALTDKIGSLRGAIESFGGLPSFLKPQIDELLRMPGLSDAARNALMGMVDGLVPDFARLEETAKKYGITLEALGPKFQQANIDRTALEIFKAFDQITQAGGDVGGVLLGMSDEISALVQQALQFGVAIPENMKPLIENLIAAGQLVDAAGNKITDLSGLTFHDTPLDKGSQAIVDAIKELRQLFLDMPGVVRAMAGDVSRELRGIEIPDLHVPIRFDVADMPELPELPGGGVPTFQRGGPVRKTGLALVHRGEFVVPADATATDSVVDATMPSATHMSQQMDFFLGEHGHGFNHILETLRRIELSLQRQSDSIWRSVRDGLLLAGR